MEKDGRPTKELFSFLVALIAWAKELGRTDCADVLEQTLSEEKAADAKLTQLAESRLNRTAA